MVLLISYDLNGNERPAAYEAVKKIITTNAHDYIKPLYSQWFVKTYDTPDVWVDRLKAVTDGTDRLFVLQVRQPYQGLLMSDQWEWINSNA